MAQNALMASEWTVLRHCGSLQEAEFVRSLLDTEGLEAEIPDEYALGVNPGFTNAFGGARVLVHAEDLVRAQELLSLSGSSAD